MSLTQDLGRWKKRKGIGQIRKLRYMKKISKMIEFITPKKPRAGGVTLA